MHFNKSNFEEYVNEQIKHLDNGLTTFALYPEFSIFAAGVQVVILVLIFIFIQIIFREVSPKQIVWSLFISMIIVILYFLISVSLRVFDHINWGYYVLALSNVITCLHCKNYGRKRIDSKSRIHTK